MIEPTREQLLKVALDDIRSAWLIAERLKLGPTLKLTLKVAGEMMKKEIVESKRVESLKTAKAEKGTKENVRNEPEPARS